MLIGDRYFTDSLVFYRPTPVHLTYTAHHYLIAICGLVSPSSGFPSPCRLFNSTLCVLLVRLGLFLIYVYNVDMNTS